MTLHRQNVRIRRSRSAAASPAPDVSRPSVAEFLHSRGLYFDSVSELRQYMRANNIEITPRYEKVLADLQQQELAMGGGGRGGLRAPIDNAIAKLRARSQI